MSIYEKKMRQFRKTVVLMLFIIIGILMFSCGDDNVLPVTAQVNLSFNTVTTSSGESGGRVMANSLAFTSGFITLSRVKFKAETGADSIEIKLKNVTKIDFATGLASPNIGGLTIPAGAYDEVEVGVELHEDGETPAVVLTGTFTDADDVVQLVRFDYNSGEMFEVELKSGVTFGAGEEFEIQVTFDPNVWFSEVSDEQLADANKDERGVIVINDTYNADIFNIVADGLNLATEVEISRI